MIVEDLKKSIYDSAMMGKLTLQLSTDTSIEEIYKFLKFDINLSNIKDSEIPFEIPGNWKWERLGNLGETSDTSSFSDGPFGSNLKTQHYILEPEVRIIQLSNIGENGWINDNVKYTSFSHLKTISRCEVKAGDFAIAKMMPAGRPVIIPDLGTKVVLGSDAVKFVPNKVLNQNYLYYCLKSPMFIKQVYSEVHGITRVRTSLNKLKNYLIPIPPLEEQQRIVERINDLFNKLDNVKQIEDELILLKSKFSEEMKNSILLDAFLGNWSKETVSKWDEFKLNSLAEIYTGNSISETIKKSKYTNLSEGYNYIGTKDLNFDHSFEYNNGVKIPYNETGFKYAKENDILMCIEGGSAGKKIGILSEKVCFGNKLCKFSTNRDIINYKFLYYYLQSPIFLRNFNDNLSGIIGGVSINKIKQLVIKIPSLEEQQRIVDKLEQLLPLCEDIENIVNG